MTRSEHIQYWMIANAMVAITVIWVVGVLL
jgi:hypothetical protein